MEKNKLFLSLLTLPIIVSPILPLAACNNGNKTTYSITFDKIEGVKFETELPTSIKSGETLYLKLNTEKDKFLDTEFSDILVGTESIKDKPGVEITSTYLKVPGKWVTGNLTIKVIASSKYTINNTSTGITFTGLPNTILAGHDIDVNYKIDDKEQTLALTDSDILVGGKSIKYESGVIHKNGRLYIPANLITGNIDIKLVAEKGDCVITLSTAEGGTLGQTTYYTVGNSKWKDIKDDLPAVTYDQGYTSHNWYENGAELKDDTVIDSDLTLEARFEGEAFLKGVWDRWHGYTQYKYDVANKKYNDTGLDWFLRGTHFDNSNILYVQLATNSDYKTADSYLTYWLSTWYTMVTDDRSTTITNIKNNSTCIIDYKTQTLTFDDYDAFIDTNSLAGPMTQGAGGGGNYYKTIKTVQYSHTSGPKVIHLRRYNIKAYLVEDDGVKYGFIPWELFRNIINVPNRSTSDGYYVCKADYNGTGFYEMVNVGQAYDTDKSYTSEDAIAAAKAEKSLAPDGFYNQNYMEYTYNLFALTLDTRFGLVERVRRLETPDIKTYLPNGAYAELKNYHDKMVSTDADVSCEQGMRQFFKDKLDDGGHSVYNSHNVLSETPITDKNQLYGEECLDKREFYKDIANAKGNNNVANYWVNKKGEDWYNTNKPTGYYKEYTSEDKTPIAYLTFDNFKAPSSTADWADDEKNHTEGGVKKPRELQSCTDENNYYKDTLRLTMYANKMIKQDNVKDVVIDLTTNGGGTVYTEHFIASWLCGGVTEKIYNPHTGSYCEYEIQADINGDGIFDENDYLSEDDIRVYIITTSYSFSCGNLLPCNVQDCRTKNTYFIGTKSGGGACYVDSALLGGLGTNYQFASSFHILRGNSTSTKFITADTGNTITDGWSYNDRDGTERTNLFDRENIINPKIWDLQ